MWGKGEDSKHAVFLSGNGPLVEVLQEALARDEVRSAKVSGNRITRLDALRSAKKFIQNIHHFRDGAIEDRRAPFERIVVFDEAQRAWTQQHTAKFMKSKKGIDDFDQSEPEFLISVMDRHQDWATIVCLVGGGQEINTGEAGIREWCEALKRSFPAWKIHVSSKLDDHEYTQGRPLFSEADFNQVSTDDDLHLSVSVRSFRSERVAAFVKAILDAERTTATDLYREIAQAFPIFVSRDLAAAKDWLRVKAGGSERYGLVASSGAIRLKPHGINVKADIDPTYWFLNKKVDVRSSYYLEDVATEFDIQGLELDWACVAWDADLRFAAENWEYYAFRGTAWQSVKNPDARLYLKNAYRVLLTRARQGMVIFVPFGDDSDPTRAPSFYDGTYDFLRSVGIEELSDETTIQGR